MNNRYKYFKNEIKALVDSSYITSIISGSTPIDYRWYSLRLPTFFWGMKCQGSKLV